MRVEIFERTVAFNKPLPSETYHLDLHTLAQVCRAWSNIVRSSPSLWRVRSNYHDTAVLWPETIKRSAFILLTLHIRTWSHGVESVDPADMMALMKTLARWDVATPQFDAPVELSILEVTGSAALLRYLGILARGTPPRYPNLLEGRSLRLRRIKLDHVRFPRWGDCTMAGFRTIVLRHVYLLGPSLNGYWDDVLIAKTSCYGI